MYGSDLVATLPGHPLAKTLAIGLAIRSIPTPQLLCRTQLISACPMEFSVETFVETFVQNGRKSTKDSTKFSKKIPNSPLVGQALLRACPKVDLFIAHLIE